jgi:translation initiation factor 2 beta subunit (eIF-2beta)/eIF-5
MEFELMLDEIYQEIDETKRKRENIILPDIVLIKNGTKTIWKNIKEFIKIMKRTPEHFYNFISFETSNKVNWISESKSDGLNFQYKVKLDNIKLILNKYLLNCVICKECKSYNTKLSRDIKIRKFNFICQDCKTNYFI